MRPGPILKAAISLLALAPVSAQAAPPTSIIRDGSLGPAGPVSSTNPGFYEITPSMGKTVGSNLFQSFGIFDLGTGDTADFTANPGTQNIIARVTGGSASTIDGTLESAANLYFINPAGIMFTANAQLNVNGAFVASTANYAKLSDGTIFYADLSHPINDAGLSSAPISAFGFTSATPQPVTFTGPTLTNAGGIHVIAGNITLDQGSPDGVNEQGTSLLAPGGNLTLFSAAGAGEVPFSPASPGSGFASATNTSFGTITVQNGSSAAIDSTQGGGSVVIRGGQLVVNDSAVSSANSGSNPGGNVLVQAESMMFQNAGQIIASTSRAGTAGNIIVKAKSLTVDGAHAPAPTSTTSDAGLTGIFSTSSSGATGNAGSVAVFIGDDLSILNSGQISAATFSQGSAGSVSIAAASLTLNGSGTLGSFTGINAESEPGATGEAGSVTVIAANLLCIEGGGQIESNTLSSASAGDVTVDAGSLKIDGSAARELLTGIFSRSDGAVSSMGVGGNITVRVAGALNLSEGGEISSSTDTSGNAGVITVDAGSVNISGNAVPNDATGIFASSLGDALNRAIPGSGGNVTIRTRSLTLDGGIITSASRNSYPGYITVVSDKVELSGLCTIDASGIDGGDIYFNVANLLYVNDSAVNAGGTGGPGTQGGNINTTSSAFTVLGNNFIIDNDDPGGLAGDDEIITEYYFSQQRVIPYVTNSLVPHPTIQLPEENRLQETCARSVNHESSSLIVVGRGGTELAPDELQPDFGMK